MIYFPNLFRNFQRNVSTLNSSSSLFSEWCYTTSTKYPHLPEHEQHSAHKTWTNKRSRSLTDCGELLFAAACSRIVQKFFNFARHRYDEEFPISGNTDKFWSPSQEEWWKVEETSFTKTTFDVLGDRTRADSSNVQQWAINIFDIRKEEWRKRELTEKSTNIHLKSRDLTCFFNYLCAAHRLTFLSFVFLSFPFFFFFSFFFTRLPRYKTR